MYFRDDPSTTQHHVRLRLVGLILDLLLLLALLLEQLLLLVLLLPPDRPTSLILIS
jgi:hypothetical protein